jgi:hypothetical protein
MSSAWAASGCRAGERGEVESGGAGTGRIDGEAARRHRSCSRRRWGLGVELAIALGQERGARAWPAERPGGIAPVLPASARYPPRAGHTARASSRGQGGRHGTLLSGRRSGSPRRTPAPAAPCQSCGERAKEAARAEPREARALGCNVVCRGPPVATAATIRRAHSRHLACGCGSVGRTWSLAARRAGASSHRG